MVTFGKVESLVLLTKKSICFSILAESTYYLSVGIKVLKRGENNEIRRFKGI